MILSTYERILAESQSPLLSDARSRQQASAKSAEILSDLEVSVRANSVKVDEHYKPLVCSIDETEAVGKLHPTDMQRAGTIFFNVTLDALTRHVNDDPSLIPSFVIAIRALNESIDRRIRETTLTFTGYLLDRVHRAHLDERRRIARELHDRLGEGVSGALRQLELHELTETEQPIEPAPHTTLAKEALVEAIDRLRLVVSDLRRDPVTSLEKALNDYTSSFATDVDVRLRVSGDESWAVPTVLDETFMIIREALRNAIAHGAPQQVLIDVDLAPHKLRARVEDDGRGFDPGRYVTARTAGLATMQERAALIGGSLSVSSSSGLGTRVELLVPLPGRRVKRSN